MAARKRITKRPLATLVQIEEAVKVAKAALNPPRWGTELLEWGPCGAPPQIHRWTEWVEEPEGDFILAHRECKDCKFYVGVMA